MKIFSGDCCFCFLFFSFLGKGVLACCNPWDMIICDYATLVLDRVWASNYGDHLVFSVSLFGFWGSWGKEWEFFGLFGVRSG